MKTYAPSDTNCWAVASPIPLLPPVTRAIFPESLLALMTWVLSDPLLVSLHLFTVRYIIKHHRQKHCQRFIYLSVWNARKRYRHSGVPALSTQKKRWTARCRFFGGRATLARPFPISQMQ